MTDLTQASYKLNLAQSLTDLTQASKAALFDELFDLLDRCGVLLLNARAKHEAEIARHPLHCQLQNGLIQPPSRRRCTCYVGPATMLTSTNGLPYIAPRAEYLDTPVPVYSGTARTGRTVSAQAGAGVYG